MIGVRVAGSPVDDLRGLRFAASWGLAAEHVALTAWLQTEGQALSDLLFSVIGGCADGGVKPVLVALRRAVFQGKAPGDRAWSDGVRRALPADLVARIAAWAVARHSACTCPVTHREDELWMILFAFTVDVRRRCADVGLYPPDARHTAHGKW